MSTIDYCIHTADVRILNLQTFANTRQLLRHKSATVIVTLKLWKSTSDGFSAIDDYAKDGGKELFTKMHCVL